MTYKTINVYLLNKVDYSQSVSDIKKDIKKFFPLIDKIDRRYFSKNIADYILQFKNNIIVKVRFDTKNNFIIFIKHI